MNASAVKETPMIWSLAPLRQEDPARDQPRIISSQLITPQGFSAKEADRLLSGLKEKIQSFASLSDAEMKRRKKEIQDAFWNYFTMIDRIDVYCMLAKDLAHGKYNKNRMYDEAMQWVNSREEEGAGLARPLVERGIPILGLSTAESRYGAMIDLVEETFNTATEEIQVTVKGKKVALAEAIGKLASLPPEERERTMRSINRELGGKEPQSLKSGKDYCAAVLDLWKELIANEQTPEARVVRAREKKTDFNDKDLRDWKQALGFDKPIPGTYAALAHRYIRMRTAYMGQKKLNSAHFASSMFEADPIFSFEEAKDILREAFTEICGKEFIEDYLKPKGYLWLDRKRSAGTIHSYYTPAYVSQPFHGMASDIYELAHEISHAYHYRKCNEKRALDVIPDLQDEFIAMLLEFYVTQKMLAKYKNKDPQKYREALADSVLNIIDMIVRRGAEAGFEETMHRLPILDKESVERAWLENAGKAFGESFDLESYRNRIYYNHIYYRPFTAQLYSQLFCLGLAVVKSFEGKDPKEFGSAYRAFVDASASKPGARFKDLFESNFGIKLADAWRSGYSVLERQIDALETEVKKARDAKPNSFVERLKLEPKRSMERAA